eukprot:2860926-Amphidinium_carterae.2
MAASDTLTPEEVEDKARGQIKHILQYLRHSLPWTRYSSTSPFQRARPLCSGLLATQVLPHLEESPTKGL